MTFKEYCKLLYDEAASPKHNIYKNNVIKYGSFINSETNNFKYEFEYLPFYNDLNDKYKMKQVAGDGDSFSQIINIMQWLTDNTHYCGYSNFPTDRLPNDILDYSFEKGFDGAINCASKAILMSDLLMSVGIFAMPVWTINYIMCNDSEYFAHSTVHCVVHAYVNELEKWVMFDPSFNSYFIDDNENPLNLIEIHNSLIQEKEIRVAQYSLNGTDIFKEKYAQVFVYNSILCITFWRGNAFEKRKYDFTNCTLIPENLDYVGFLKNVLENVALTDDMKQHVINGIENFKKVYVNEFLAKPN